MQWRLLPKLAFVHGRAKRWVVLVVFILLLFCFILPSVSLSVDEGPFYCLFLTLSCKYSVAIATRGPKIQNMMTLKFRLL